MQLRGVLRQLIAMGALNVQGQVFNTLQLTEGSRAVLRGEISVLLRESVSQKAEKRSRICIVEGKRFHTKALLIERDLINKCL